MISTMHHGYIFLSDHEIELTLWAPLVSEAWVLFPESGSKVKMTREESGFHIARVDAKEGSLYRFSLDNGKIIADPASRFQPQGVTGPSMFLNPSGYGWKFDSWETYGMGESIIQELHVGAYSPEGKYSGLKEKIDHLKDVGINTVELMPLAQCYGSRNWGYDGVFPFAPNFSYGTPNDLKSLIDAYHGKDINVILDVVYNHFGPLGGVFHDLGPYFSSTYRNPWGEAINYDSGGSDAVRGFILQNVRYWLEEFRFDGLRLDAIHSIYDSSPTSILKEISSLSNEMQIKLGRRIKLIAETDRNDPATVTPQEKCGLGMDAQWNDDFHHAIHSYLTGEKKGYYSDYGDFDKIVRAYTNGFVYDGVYSRFLGKVRGSRFKVVPSDRLVVFTQNHDQVGNRAYGERPVNLMGDDVARLFAASVILSPYVPMLFMGEENGEKNPFLFFADSTDKAFTETVRSGRISEFSAFGWDTSIPDPFAESSFKASVLDWDSARLDRGMKFNKFYRDLIRLRTMYISGREHIARVAAGSENVIELRYGENFVVFLSYTDRRFQPGVEQPYEVIMDTSDPKYGGTGSENGSGRGKLIMEPYSAVALSVH
ncbi:MAG: malto-oligosyltrehalose trehalohydrolase [Thermoplasmataceae archaeon]